MKLTKDVENSVQLVDYQKSMLSWLNSVIRKRLTITGGKCQVRRDAMGVMLTPFP